MRRRLIIVGATTLALMGAGVGAGIALSGGGDDGDAQAHGPGAQRAAATALAYMPGGTVTAVERDSEDGATWEVEVRRPGGGSVDIRLGADYSLVVAEPDSEADEGPGPDR